MSNKTALQTLNDACLKFVSNACISGPILVVGENVNVGSYISGLSSFLKDLDAETIKTVNLPNVESITAGVCFGWNLNAGPSFVFIKQLDFLPLYFDDLINTKNMFDRLGASYNVNLISFVVDTRLEGAQSSWRQIDTIAQLLKIDFYPISHVTSVSEVMRAFETKGLKLFVISQKYANRVLDPDKRILKVQRSTGDAFEGFEVYSRDFDEHPWPMVVSRSVE